MFWPLNLLLGETHCPVVVPQCLWLLHSEVRKYYFPKFNSNLFKWHELKQKDPDFFFAQMAQFSVNDPATSQPKNSTQCSTLREVSMDKLPVSQRWPPKSCWSLNWGQSGLKGVIQQSLLTSQEMWGLSNKLTDCRKAGLGAVAVTRCTIP